MSNYVYVLNKNIKYSVNVQKDDGLDEKVKNLVKLISYCMSFVFHATFKKKIKNFFLSFKM